MSTQTQTGLIPLVEGQQSYVLVFSPPFASVPSFADATAQMPNDSGEVFTASIDRSTLSALGCTVWLSGIPTAASVGGYINWYALGPFASVSTSAGSGITVVQLFHRMARRLRGGDFTKLSMTEQTDLQDAANAALMRLYNILPNYFKEQTQGFVLPGPKNVANVGVVQFGKFVTGLVFTEAQFGQTIVLEGDAGWNQIVGTDELLNPYMGDTGVVTGVIYGNAIHSDTFPLDRIIGDPQYANQNMLPICRNTMVAASSPPANTWWWAQSVGPPQTWWPQVFGNSQGKKPIMVMRFAPAPDQAYAINVRIGFWPKRLTLADYDNATELVAADQFIESALIPMALQELMVSPAWTIRGDEKMIDSKGDKGELFAKNQLGQIGVPANKVFTPIGY